MRLRSPTDNETGGTPLHRVLFRVVILEHAGIQVLVPRELAWIPAFAGMTERVTASFGRLRQVIFKEVHEGHEGFGYFFDQNFRAPRVLGGAICFSLLVA